MNRKVYVSYVLQGENQHFHHSTIIKVKSSEYSYSVDNLSKNIIEWEKSITLNQNEKIIILNYNYPLVR